ncbi:exocyst complex component EXO70I-like [Prosopis cineraria]|uniref:exocyst complex component EXO70I-like n=1 Tax=Prosopis cineraria TaxID=364024 RepID=UPI002410AD36|nr:exocyst complex component EXO70I-like [Prosopis cineraria]
MAPTGKESAVINLESACSNLKDLLQASKKLEDSLAKMGTRFNVTEATLSTVSKSVAPLQTLAMSTKALDTRINRAISPAVGLLDSFKFYESLQQKLLDLSSILSEKTPQKRLQNLLDYTDCVDQLNEAISSISQDGELVIQKLQEVVEFISRTKAADQYMTQRLRETLITLKALYETEVDAMRFEGLLDQALLHMQDELESILLQIKHHNVGEYDTVVDSDLGSELEIEVLRRISDTLAANDCLDICIDIYVKVRYRRAAKALMRLNPDYLRTYTPEGIDEMEWESLEMAITLWIQHFEVAIKKVLLSEKKLCCRVLGKIMAGLVWPECFAKIADKIMAVFFRFGESVARSSKEPQKLFKLLDMFETLDKLKPEFSDIFDGEAGMDFCTRFRELEKLIIDASSKVFWEFGLQIEGNADGIPPPRNGSVPKLVRYAINYLKYLATKNYRESMGNVLETEQVWKAGILSKPDAGENLLKEAVFNIMDALQRNMESKRSRCRDKTLIYIFTMNTYWYIYMRARNSELGELLGDQYLKRKYKAVAEESAYLYQMQAWGVLVRILDMEEVDTIGKNIIVGIVTEKIETFLKCVNDTCQKHKECYNIPDEDLREQIKEASLKLVVEAYTEFLDSCSGLLQRKSYPSPERLQALVGRAFNGGEVKLKRRTFTDQMAGRSATSLEGEIKDFQQSRSKSSDV